MQVARLEGTLPRSGPSIASAIARTEGRMGAVADAMDGPERVSPRATRPIPRTRPGRSRGRSSHRRTWRGRFRVPRPRVEIPETGRRDAAARSAPGVGEHLAEAAGAGDDVAVVR